MTHRQDIAAPERGLLPLERILEACRQGDELAWEMLVRRYQGRVHGLALGYSGDPDEARDLTQAVFVRVYRHLDRCRRADRFLPWLIRLTRNLCLDHLRRRRARPPLRDIPADEHPGLVAAGPDPEQLWEREGRRHLVRRALAELDQDSREVVLLKDMQGLSVEEVAALLEVPPGTVKSRCHRARLELARAVRRLLDPTDREALA